MAPTFILKSEDGKPLVLNTAADIAPYIKSLKDNLEVEEIKLGGNTLGIEACRALADVLKTNINLKIFNAADIFTQRLITEIPEALSALLTALLTLPHLHTVDLSDNAFGGRLADPLKEFYSKAGPLRHLLLNNNGLGPAGGTIVANAIRDLAALKAANPNLPPLETVVCGRNRLENGSMDAWADAYAAHRSLKTVKMTQNGIRPEGIERLLRGGLAMNAGLQTLDLQDNTFTVTGARALADVITGWQKLTELGVSDCLLGRKGGILLAAAIGEEKNCLLKKLSLQYNEIDHKGLEAFSSSITKALPVLEHLEMNGNIFADDNPFVENLKALFAQRGIGELDSLSDMEEEDEEDEDEDEGSDDEENERKKAPHEDVIKKADEAEAQKVPQEKDRKVDDLADLLGGTSLA